MRGLAVWLALLVVPAANALDWSKPWSEPQDAAAARDQSDEYAWRLFIALNWPADPIARTADRASRLGAERPVVWETWQSAGDVYLEDGADPGPWQPGRRNQAVPAERRFETFSLKDLPNARHIVGGVMVPLVDPLASARRLTEIRLNRATFQFIRSRELYNVDGQLRAVAAGRTVSFPYGAKGSKRSGGRSARPSAPAITLCSSLLLTGRSGFTDSPHCISPRRICRPGFGQPSNTSTIRPCRMARAGNCRRGMPLHAGERHPTAIARRAMWVWQVRCGSTIGCAAQ